MVAKQLYLDNLDRVGREENIAGGKSERPNVIRKEITGDQAAPRTAVSKVRSQAPVRQAEWIITLQHNYCLRLQVKIFSSFLNCFAKYPK